MYPSTSLFIAIGQAAIVILVLFSYPLQILPCRDSLDKVFHSFQAQPPKAITEDGDLDNFEDPDHAHIEMTPLKHTLLTSAIVGLGFIIALFVDDLRIGAPPLSNYTAHRPTYFMLQYFHLLGRRGLPRYHLFSRGYFTGRWVIN